MESIEDANLENPCNIAPVLTSITTALQNDFVEQAIGEHVRFCCDRFKELLDPAGKKIGVENEETRAVEKQNQPRQNLYEAAWGHLKEAEQAINAFKSGSKDLDKVLQEVKRRAPRTRHQNPEDFEIIMVGPDTMYPESSRSGKTKTEHVEAIQYLGWTLEPGILKVAEELRYDGTVTMAENIAVAFHRAQAAEYAFNALMRTFEEVGKLEGFAN